MHSFAPSNCPVGSFCFVVHLLGTRRDERKALLKSESDAVIEAHNSPDTYNQLAGNATWRLLNAHLVDRWKHRRRERKLELMKITGDREGEPNTDAIKVAHTANLSNLPLFITGSIFC
jgi:hypothetical protein